MGFWEDIRALREANSIPRSWKRADIRPYLLEQGYEPLHIGSRPSNDSLSGDGRLLGDSVKKGGKPKAWRTGPGMFELIADPEDTPAVQQSRMVEAFRVRDEARSASKHSHALSSSRERSMAARGDYHMGSTTPALPSHHSSRAARFDSVVAKMPSLLQQLQDCSPLRRNQLPRLPARGVYVFYENGIPAYVGRSNGLRRRIMQHSRPSSKHNSATFAFILAKEEAAQRGLSVSEPGRLGMQNDAVFNQLYLSAKGRVGRMQIRVVEVKDPIEQTLFEVYAALALETPYNDFDTH